MVERLDLAALFASHEARVFTYLRRLAGDREAARDLTQETFVRALGAAHRYAGNASVETWLLGIARNVFGNGCESAGTNARGRAPIRRRQPRRMRIRMLATSNGRSRGSSGVDAVRRSRSAGSVIFGTRGCATS